MHTGLDTDFHNQQLDFPTVTVCPLEPFNATFVNDTAYGSIGSYEATSHLNIPMLQALAKLSYDSVGVASELASQIPALMVIITLRAH
jgi:amiloride-sensitive sodium channel